MDCREKAHRLLTQVVNSLTAKMEIGAPMAAMYLLDNPDHYIHHKFCTFYWKNYVHEVQKSWKLTLEDDKPEKVIINKSKGKFVGLSPVHDYVYRPKHYKRVSLYDWIQLYSKKTRPKGQGLGDEESDEWHGEQSREDYCQTSGSTARLNPLKAEGPMDKYELNTESGVDDNVTDNEEKFETEQDDDEIHAEDSESILDADEILENIQEYFPFRPGHPLCDIHYV